MITPRHIGMAVAYGVVALASAELFCRIDDRVRLGVPIMHTPNSDRDLKLRDSLVIRGRPNGRYRQNRLNNYGFRGSDIAHDPAPGCTRIMVLGASESFGMTEPPGKEYPAQLADSLRGDGCYEVVNAAMAGAGIRSIIQLWNGYAAQFRPQFVIVYPSPVFYLGNVAPEWPTPPGTPQVDVPEPFRPRLIEQIKNVVDVPDFLQRRRVERWIAAAIAGKPHEWFFTAPPGDRLHQLVGDLDSLVTAIQAQGARPVLMTHAMRFKGPRNSTDEMLLLQWRQFSPRATADVMLQFEQLAADSVRDLAHRRGVMLVDIDRSLTGRRQLFGDFAHFTSEGAGVVAGAIAHEIGRADARLAGSTEPMTNHGLP